MKTEIEDSPFMTPERRPRRQPERRYIYEWEKAGPQPELRWSFECCGTLYRFANADDRDRAIAKHGEVRHGR